MAGKPKIDWDDPENIKKVEQLGVVGITTIEEIARYFQVDPATIHRAKRKSVILQEAIKRGKIQGTVTVSKTLFNKAVAGNVTAMIFFLKNRAPELWRDVQKLEHSGEIDSKATVHWLIEKVKEKASDKERGELAEEIRQLAKGGKLN